MTGGRASRRDGTRAAAAPGRWRARLRDGRRQRRLAANTYRDLLPPRPARFARFGEGSYLVPPVRVHNPQFMEIGAGVEIQETGFLSAQPRPGGPDPHLVIGDGTTISAGVTIATVGEVEIGPHVLFAARVFVGDASHAFEDPDRPIIAQGMTPSRGVRIGQGSFLGINSVVLPGARIGRGVMVGAGSVVAGEIPDHSVVVGNPARLVRRHVPGRGWVTVDGHEPAGTEDGPAGIQ